MLGDGAARGATPGPFARSSRKIHQLSPSSSSRANIRPFVTPPAALAHEALFAVSPRPYYRPTLYFGLILRHPASYASFVPFAVPPRTLAFIAFFYRILYFPCHPRALRASPRALSSRISRLAPLTRHNASGVRFLRRPWIGWIFKRMNAPVRLPDLAIAREVLSGLNSSPGVFFFFFFTKRENGSLLVDNNGNNEREGKRQTYYWGIVIGINVGQVRYTRC